MRRIAPAVRGYRSMSRKSLSWRTSLVKTTPTGKLKAS